ncbi:MAG: aspartate kinase [Muribaculaceae bacterium]|nr:aspartate kinase [Muribaculaceae bacterium]
MIVLKFGGTSVGTSESLYNVKKIVESLDDDAVVVVSALGGLTDRLIATAKKASAGDKSYIEDFEAMAVRHYDIINDVVAADCAQLTRARIEPLLLELKQLYDGISLIADLPERTLARIVSLGERMSSIIVTDMIAGARHVNSLDIIKTEKYFDKNIAATELTERLIRENLNDGPYPVVMGGFISSDKDTGEVTNLGRGGSDYTAALVAAALNADVLQIWTDVDGFLTADPRIVKDACVIDEMSFVESMDLCTFGAKVIYPPTIYPVFHKNIPIRILNTHRPDAPGTLISEHPAVENRPNKYIVGISAIKDEALITMRGHYASDSKEIAGRTFNVLSLKGLTPHLVAGDNSLNTFSFAIANKEASQAVRLLKEEFAPELLEAAIEVIEMKSGLAGLAVVGDNLKSAPAMTDRLVSILEDAEIPILALTDKASETNTSFVISEVDVNNALLALHDAIF